MGLSVKKLIGLFYKSKEWKSIEYFDDSWKKRIFQMSRYIRTEDSIVDYGCGKMWLKEYLSKSNTYIGVDYQKRDDATIVCDFNKKEFPNLNSTVAFVSGCLEYVEDPKWFLNKIAEHHEKCIISYCCTDQFEDYKQRKDLGWKNHLSKRELINLFGALKMLLKESDETLTRNQLFYFEKDKR